MPTHTIPAHPGDSLEVNSRGGRAARRGEVLELLGAPGHEHYRVRWADGHESIVFPTEGVHIVRREEAEPQP